MSFPTEPIPPGSSFTVTETAIAMDAMGNTRTVEDAVVSFEIDTPDIAMLTDLGSEGGTGSALFTALSEGTATGTTYVTNNDGSVIASPYSFTVRQDAGDPSLATEVIVT